MHVQHNGDCQDGLIYLSECYIEVTDRRDGSIFNDPPLSRCAAFEEIAISKRGKASRRSPDTVA